MNTPLLKIGDGNSKLKKAFLFGDWRSIHTFSLPSGYTCPGARDCLAWSNRKTGKIKDGTQAKFRCFSASEEAIYKNVRKSRWHNYDLLREAKTWANMVKLISDSINAKQITKGSLIRVHVGGDYFSRVYLRAWIDSARRFPNLLFYSYTKSTHLFDGLKIPGNFIFTFSQGGKFDHLIPSQAKTARVVFSKDEAETLGLDIDHDDSHAYNGSESFALLLHGVQQKGTPAAQAKKDLKKRGWKGYSKNGS